jgi:hypothetical protein
MNKDPVFSYNGSLPDVSNVHTATWTYHCPALLGSAQNAATTPSTLLTEQGWRIEYPNGAGTSSTFTPPAPGLPGSLRIEVLREEGAPEVVQDNSGRIAGAFGGGGCGVAAFGQVGGGVGIVTSLLFAFGLTITLRRRRKR